MENVHKKLLIQAAACNLALLMRSIYGVGKPRAAHDGLRRAVFAILAFMRAVEAFYQPPSVHSDYLARPRKTSANRVSRCRMTENQVV
jgi:hypothetical protein